MLVLRNPAKSMLWKRLYEKRHDKDTIFYTISDIVAKLIYSINRYTGHSRNAYKSDGRQALFDKLS